MFLIDRVAFSVIATPDGLQAAQTSAKKRRTSIPLHSLVSGERFSAVLICYVFISARMLLLSTKYIIQVLSLCLL